METTFIYALCEPGTRTVRYIGKSNDPKRRFKEHLKSSANTKTPLGDWLRGLSEKPTLVILREVLDEEWEMAEERYIRLARGCRMPLVNSTDGGDGITMTPEIRAKIGAAHTGVIFTPERCANISIGKTGKSRVRATPETIAKMSAAQKRRWASYTPEIRAVRVAALTGENNPSFGKKRSPEYCAKLSAAMTGEKNPNFGKSRSLETRAKMSASHQRRLALNPVPSGESHPSFGKIHTPEARANMSAGQQRRRDREKSQSHE